MERWGPHPTGNYRCIVADGPAQPIQAAVHGNLVGVFLFTALGKNHTTVSKWGRAVRFDARSLKKTRLDAVLSQQIYDWVDALAAKLGAARGLGGL